MDSLITGLFEKDKLPAQVITLKNDSNMQISMMDIGASWVSCKIPLANDKTTREVLLGTKTLEGYHQQSAYMGATIGRFANRIANAEFSLNGETYQLSCNNNGNCLHGGMEGFSHQRWQLELFNKQKVIFSLFSSDMTQGFPGNIKVSVCYTLTDDNQVIIDYQATTDKTTPLNLTNHAYFNLMGAETNKDCLEHRLFINAAKYLPVNKNFIPLGKLESVNNNGFNFLIRKKIKQHFLQDKQQIITNGYDHAFVLNNNCQHGKTTAAILDADDDSVRLSIATTMPAIQLYTGNFLQGTPSRKQNTPYQNYAGIALETEFFPDSPNQLTFPNCFITPTKNYHHTTWYKFTVNKTNLIP